MRLLISAFAAHAALLVLSPTHSNKHWQKDLDLSFPGKTELVYLNSNIFDIFLGIKKPKKVCALC